MLKTFELVKIFLNEAFKFNKAKEPAKNGKSKLPGIIIITVILFIVYGYIFVNIFNLSFSGGVSAGVSIDTMILYPIFMINLIALAFMFLAGNFLSFTDKDMSVLGPLPIDEKKIVTAKLIVTYIYESIFQIFIAICAIISYFIVGGVTIQGILAIVFSGLLSTVVPLLLFSFLILIIKRAIQKSKQRKSLELFFSFFSLGLIVLISFGSSFLTTSSSTNPVQLIISIKNIANYYPLMIFIKLGLEGANVLYILLYAVISLLLFYLFILIFNKFAYRLMLSYKFTREEKKKGPIEYKKKNPMAFLINKEFGRMFSSNVYLMNILIMPIMAIIGAFYISISSTVRTTILSITDFNLASYITLGMIIMIELFIFTSAITLSLEGKYLWIIKSLPLDRKDIFKSKVIFNMIIQNISSIIVLIIMAIAFKLDIYWIIGILVFTVATSYGSSVYYLRINLKHPKLDASDIIIIKQSASVMIVSLTSFLIAGVEAMIFYVLQMAISPIASLYLVSALNIFIGLMYHLSIKKKGQKYFDAFY